MDKKKKQLMVCVSVVLGVLLILGSAWLVGQGPALEPNAKPVPVGGLLGNEPTVSTAPVTADDDTALLVGRSMDKLERQAQVDAGLLAELESMPADSIKEPLVLLDPYGLSPLSAVALFRTEEETQITVRIPGDSPNAEVTYTLEEYATDHRIPVCGLYPGRVNRVELTAHTRDGKSSTVTVEVETEPLMEDLQEMALLAKTFDERAYQPGLNFSFSSLDELPYRFAFDCDGVIRWYLTGERYGGNVGNGAAYQTGTRGFFFPYGSMEQGTVLFEETDPLGRIYGVYYAPYGSHHDTVLTDRDTLLVDGSNTGAADGAIADFVYELDLGTGKILHTLDYKQVLQRTRVFGSRYSDGDWMHLNTAVYCGDDVVASSNFQSLVLCTDWDGNIKWKLGDPTNYLEQYQEYLLTPVGEGFEWPYNQHAAQILPDYDGDPDTVDLLIFDNGQSRFVVDRELQRQINNKEIAQTKPYSRLVHYRVDTRAMTVEQIWQYGKERPELYGEKRGDANLLPNGNILGLFSVTVNSSSTGHAVYQEVDRAGNTVWQCLAQSLRSSNFYCEYKTERRALYDVNGGELSLGEAPGVYIPEAILSACGY